MVTIFMVNDETEMIMNISRNIFEIQVFLMSKLSNILVLQKINEKYFFRNVFKMESVRGFLLSSNIIIGNTLLGYWPTF